MDAETLHRPDDLRSGIKSLFYWEVSARCSGFCSPELLIGNGFEYSFTSLNIYKTQFSDDPIILEGLQAFKASLDDICN